MSSLAFIFDIVFSCILSFVFLYRCGNFRRQHPITTAAVFISWFFSIMIVFILPLDISLVCHWCISRKLTRTIYCRRFIGIVCHIYRTICRPVRMWWHFKLSSILEIEIDLISENYVDHNVSKTMVFHRTRCL